MQALVLVGGEGTRLRPLTATVPKPVVPLAGRPLISYMIDWLAGHGVEEVILACGFLPDALRATLGEGGSAGARGSATWSSPRPLGTAGAIRFAADCSTIDFSPSTATCSPTSTSTALVREHEARGARATLGLVAVADASAYGLVHTGPRRRGDRVHRETRNRGGLPPREINAGTYVLERSVLDLIEPGRAVSIEHDVFPELIGEGLFALPLSRLLARRRDAGRYLEATWDILEGRVRTEVEPATSRVAGRPHGRGRSRCLSGTARGDLGRLQDRSRGADQGVGPAAGCEVGDSAVVIDSILAHRSAGRPRRKA